MNKWQRRQLELPENIRVWLNELMGLPDSEVKCQIATYLVEHNANLMISLDKARKSVKGANP